MVFERLRAVLHQRIGAHVIIRADQEASQGVHKREVSITTVAWPEYVLNEWLQPLVAEARVDVGDEFLLLSWPDVEQLRSSFGLFENRQVFVHICLCGIVKDDHLNGVS